MHNTCTFEILNFIPNEQLEMLQRQVKINFQCECVCVHACMHACMCACICCVYAHGPVSNICQMIMTDCACDVYLD